MDISVVVAGLVVMVMSLVGVIFATRRAEAWLGERISYLVAFSAGVFLVTGGAMVLEVFHIFETALWWGFALIVLGYAGGWLVSYVMPESHHHHDPHDHGHHHGRTSAYKIIIGDTVHNIGDGIMLVAAFATGPALGLAVTVSVLIHEALQELSEFFVLKQAGYSTKRALTINFLVSSTVFVGIGLAYLALATHELEGLLLALGAGFFLHVVLHDLLPKRQAHASLPMFLQHLAVVVIGLLVMSLVAFALTGDHSHGEEGEETEHGEEHKVVDIHDADHGSHTSSTNPMDADISL